MTTSHDIDFSLLTKRSDARSFSAGEMIFAAGDAASELYVVKAGQVDIKLGNRLLETVGPNGIFGEMALIDGSPRSASAVAASSGELVPLNEKQFLFLVGETPYFALNVLRILTQRLRITTSSL